MITCEQFLALKEGDKIADAGGWQTWRVESVEDITTRGRRVVLKAMAVGKENQPGLAFYWYRSKAYRYGFIVNERGEKDMGLNWTDSFVQPETVEQIVEELLRKEEISSTNATRLLAAHDRATAQASDRALGL
ncbi:MAG: hypothetical protein A2571_00995 [Candidatus Vogelbacteria bacterium RIFOXYD1_FULL_44_32]|uniref:Uncharacterized protein n=1 Tax=Candidatus Vogelbacteria bacterium RIFOXYD1_FULL_44_32 TaxID=1802438 RepID=A0A1G2QEA7_9BACT|nr:MAG: hypothetical protein A2571_00995 [Candidatus Vogelbacteria bacterium RIFOXYD1_FULL_44_32]